MRIRLALLACVALMSFVVRSAAAADADIVEGARKEGKLVVYTGVERIGTARAPATPG